MIGKNKIIPLIILFFICISVFSISSFANIKFKLAEINPEQTELKIYRSYQYRLFIVSIIQKTTDAFSCSTNRYIFYHYGKDQFFQIASGNLLVNPNCTNFFATKVYSLEALNKENELSWKLEVKRIIKKLNTSSEILEKNKIITAKGSTCWQQPILYNIKGEVLEEIPQLLANFCPNQYCSDIYWKTPQKVQYWNQFSPIKIQQFEYNIATKEKTYLKVSKNITRPSYTQINAPRDEIVDPVNTKQGVHKIIDNQLSFYWQTNKKNKLVIGFQRSDVNIKAVAENLSTISSLLTVGDLKRAFQQIRFGLWLLPDHFDTKFERLKLYAKLSIYDQIFKSIKLDFSEKDTVSVCQKLHIDKNFKAIWKDEKLITLFNETCF